MWFTPIYGLPVETVQGPDADQPGVTLNGGLAGADPILAEVVEGALNGVQTDLESRTFDLETAINALAAQAAVTLDTIDTGSGTNTTEFTAIDQSYQHLMIAWVGNHDGSGHASLAIRFNGDGSTGAYISSNARGNQDSPTDSGRFLFPGSSMSFTVLRPGLVGTTGSGGVVFIPSYNISGRKSAFGIGASNSGGVATIATGGGYWAAATDPITAVRIWPSGQLWNTNPRISLVGIK